MRAAIKELLRILAETLPVSEPIVEFGALQVAGQEGFADLRPFFPGKEYLGADMREGPGVDRLLDLHHIDLPDASVGTVLVIDTFEHVEFPRQAMTEIARILRPGGMVVVTSVMDFPIHDHPHDYWRFTPDGFRSLLQVFPSSLVEQAGEELLPHTVIGLGFRGAAPDLGAFLPRLKEWTRRHAAAGRWDAGRIRKRRRQWARSAALIGLLALCSFLASGGHLAGVGLSGVLGIGLSYLLGYSLTSKAGRGNPRQTRNLASGGLLAIALALLLPYLVGPRGLRAFPLWYLAAGAAASVGAYGLGRVAGAKRRLRRAGPATMVPAAHSAAPLAAAPDPKQATIDAFCHLYFDSDIFQETYWLGVPALKCPLDLWIYQEILHEVSPDVIIETGTAHGGSALFLASVCDLIGRGRIITVDIAAREGRPQHPRITYLAGSSTSRETVEEVSRLIGEGERVLVILDSDHSKAHVLDELRIYQRFVSPGSYLIVEDTVIGHPVLADSGPGPMEAIEEFLRETRGLTRDPSREKFHLTFNPRGYLKRAE